MRIDLSWLWFAAAGVTLLFSQVFPFCWWLAIIGIACLLQGIQLARSWRPAALAGLMVGLLNAAGGYAWLWHAFPIGWIDEYPIAVQFLFFGSFYFGIVLFLSLGMAAASVGLYYFRRDPVGLLWLGPLIYVAGELIGSFFLSLWLWGDGSVPNIDMAHGYAGVALANWPLAMPVAMVFGVYGLSALAALLGVSIVVAVKNLHRFSLVPFLLLLLLVVLNLIYPVASFRERTGLSVIAVDTFFTRELVDNPAGAELMLDSTKEALIAAALRSPDYILLPEEYDSIGLDEENSALLAEIRTVAPDFTGVIINSASVKEGSKRILRSSYYDLGAGDVYHSDKQFLTAQGEYVTYIYEGLLSIFGLGDKLRQLKQNANFIPGPYTEADVPAGQPMVLMCFASASALDAKRGTLEKDVPFIAHPISHVRFREPILFWYQLRSLLRTQSIWTGKPIIIAANMSESRMYLPDGRFDEGEVLESTPLWRLVEYHP